MKAGWQLILAKLTGLFALCLVSGIAGATLVSHFGNSSYTLSYADFISILLTALGVMLAVVTLFVGLLAVLGWTSIESKLRDHSVDYIGSQLKEGEPLMRLINNAVHEAVYRGVAPEPVEDELYDTYLDHENKDGR